MSIALRMPVAEVRATINPVLAERVRHVLECTRDLAIDKTSDKTGLVSAPGPNPTAGRLLLAARLRALRLAAGKTAEEAAKELMGSTSKISRIETGERAATARDIRDLGRFYGITDQEQDELQKLAIEARKKGWWADYWLLDGDVVTYVGLETAASSVAVMENQRWPGLLQTADMTRSLLAGLRPGDDWSSEFIESQVATRKQRQKRLESGDLAVHAVLDEAIFHRNMGPGVLRSQIDKLIQLNELANVKIQISPFSAGSYPGLDGTFNLLNFGSGELQSVVFVEGLLGSYLVDKKSDVDQYRLVFTSVTAPSSRQCLDPDESQKWIKEFYVRP